MKSKRKAPKATSLHKYESERTYREDTESLFSQSISKSRLEDNFHSKMPFSILSNSKIYDLEQFTKYQLLAISELEISHKFSYMERVLQSMLKKLSNSSESEPNLFQNNSVEYQPIETYFYSIFCENESPPENLSDSKSENNSKLQTQKNGDENQLICSNKFCQSFSIPEIFKAVGKRFNADYCEQCYEAFQNEQYCLYCEGLYLDDFDYRDSDWVGCDTCPNWVHMDCEAKFSNPRIREQLETPYKCPNCLVKSKKVIKKTCFENFDDKFHQKKFLPNPIEKPILQNKVPEDFKNIFSETKKSIQYIQTPYFIESFFCKKRDEGSHFPSLNTLLQNHGASYQLRREEILKDLLLLNETTELEQNSPSSRPKGETSEGTDLMSLGDLDVNQHPKKKFIKKISKPKSMRIDERPQRRKLRIRKQVN